MKIILIAVDMLVLGMSLANPKKYSKFGLIINIICLALLLIISNGCSCGINKNAFKMVEVKYVIYYPNSNDTLTDRVIAPVFCKSCKGTNTIEDVYGRQIYQGSAPCKILYTKYYTEKRKSFKKNN